MDQFKAVTGATDEEFLSGANGDLETALATYFELQTSTEGEPAAAPASSAAHRPPIAEPATQAVSPAPPAFPSPAPTQRRAGIATFKDLSNTASQDQGNPDKPQSFFTGGEKSGLSVQDPNAPQKGQQPRTVQSLLRKAAESGTLPDPAAASGSKAPTYFSGPANTLGSDDTPSQPIPGPAGAQRSMPGAFGVDESDPEEEPVTRLLTFWADGFSIEDGPLYRYDDPASRTILDNLDQGRAPLDLLDLKFGQRVDLQVASKTTEKYRPPPKRPAKPFEGSGNRLGSPIPGPSATTTAPPPKPAASQGLQSAHVQFEVDETQPTTSLQIRLPSGDRLVGRFNHTHTVADLRRYIIASQPGLSSQPVVLQTTFPSRDLSDDSATIKDAGLLGSVVVVRLA